MLEEPVKMSAGCERVDDSTADAYQGSLRGLPPPPEASPSPAPHPSQTAAQVEPDPAEDRLYAQYGYLALGCAGCPDSVYAGRTPSDAPPVNGTSVTNPDTNGLPAGPSDRLASAPRTDCADAHTNGVSADGIDRTEVASDDAPAGTDGSRSPPPALRTRELTARADSVLRYGDLMSPSGAPPPPQQTPSTKPPDHAVTDCRRPSPCPAECDHAADSCGHPGNVFQPAKDGFERAEDDTDGPRERFDRPVEGPDKSREAYGNTTEDYSIMEGYDSTREGYGDTTDTFGQENQGEQAENNNDVPSLNALARLQHALEKNGTFNVYNDEASRVGGSEIYQCHLCSYTGNSKFHFSQHMHSHYDFKCSQCDFSTHLNLTLKDHMKDEHNLEIKDYMDEPGVRVPKVNASGKVRLHKCKFCDFKTATQVEHWEHLKSHIAPEKRFWCHVCPFITDVKHHLTYHLRNHFNSKPFKCNKCEYSCVNKSMLSSHMKSHTNFYQYRCGDCNFAAKYANALKNHLRKEKHRPGMVLNPDGSPNPFVIIDVYGTRRGPKIKKDDNGMPILPSSLQDNYVNFIQTQNKFITSPSSGHFASPYIKAEPSPMTSPEAKLALPRGYIRCDMCPYSTADRDQLTKHMMNHMTPDSQQEASPASSKSGEDGNDSIGLGREPAGLTREPAGLTREPAGPGRDSSRLSRMELLRSALAQPVRMHPPVAASPSTVPAPPGYRRAELPCGEPPPPRLPQYDSLAAHRVREYFSRALQSPLLYNLSMAAGLGGGTPPTGLPLPFSMSRPPPEQPAVPTSPPHTRVSPRPSSPPYYERAPTQQQESPQPSSPLPCPDTALDLSRLGKRPVREVSPPPPAKHRRKGRAQKLDVISQRLRDGGSPQHSLCSRNRSSSPEPNDDAGADWKAAAHTCHSCGIAFKDLVMYTMHMGFHDYRRPFSCNKCGEECRDAITFFLHIARVPHSS